MMHEPLVVPAVPAGNRLTKLHLLRDQCVTTNHCLRPLLLRLLLLSFWHGCSNMLITAQLCTHIDDSPDKVSATIHVSPRCRRILGLRMGISQCSDAGGDRPHFLPVKLSSSLCNTHTAHCSVHFAARLSRIVVW